MSRLNKLLLLIYNLLFWSIAQTAIMSDGAIWINLTIIRSPPPHPKDPDWVHQLCNLSPRTRSPYQMLLLSHDVTARWWCGLWLQPVRTYLLPQAHHRYTCRQYLDLERVWERELPRTRWRESWCHGKGLVVLTSTRKEHRDWERELPRKEHRGDTEGASWF